MGADFFCLRTAGIYKDANEAFLELVEEAQYMNGHGGYTGTIAEKNSFRMIETPKRKDPQEFVNELCDSDDSNNFWEDKWGPAACVEAKGTYAQAYRGERYKGKRNFHVYWFFGWASS